MNKAGKGLLVVLIIAGLGALALIPWYQSQQAKKSGAKAETGPPPAVPVQVAQVAPQSMENRIRVNGSIRADEEAELRPEVSGKLTAITFKEGSQVKAGDVMARINDSELRAEETRLQYEVSLAESTESRLRRLLAEGSVSQENYDRALSNLNTNRAQLELVRARLAKTVIAAPFDGTVGLKYISEGAYVTPATRIAGIRKVDRVKVDFAVPEKHALAVKVGDRIEFEIASLDQRFSGEVYAIEPMIDPVTRTLPIRAIADNVDRNLLPGSFADVTLVLGRRDNALMIPTQAVMPGLSTQRVFIMENGVARTRSITTGRRTDRLVEVTEGLNPGETVITTGLLQLRDGMSVTVQNNGTEVSP